MSNYTRGQLPRESVPKQGEKPGFVASHDTTGNEDFRRTSPLHPFPVKDADLAAEIEAVKQTQQEILARLDAGLDTRLTGSNVEEQISKLASVVDLLDKRNVVIGSISGATVEAGKSVKVINPLDISKYTFLYVTSFADIKHDYGVEFFFRTPLSIPTTHGVNTAGAYTIYESNGDIRGKSDWVEVNGGFMKVNIRNNDTVDHVYDLVLYGVR